MYGERALKIHLSLLYFRNPNEPVPVKMFWPRYTTEEQQYLLITREMTSDSVRSYPFLKELNLWRKVIPDLVEALGEKKIQESTGFCEKDGDCSP